jgi:phage shock protein PspC (stress-responsive transcriptional regulator)
MEHTELTQGLESPEAKGSGAESSRSGSWIRPRKDRIVAGVAVGLANETGLPLWFIRSVFVVGALLGGFGLAAYALGWILMRSEDADESLVDSLIGRVAEAQTPTAKVGVLLMVASGLVLLGALGIFSAPILIAGLLFAVGAKLIER